MLDIYNKFCTFNYYYNSKDYKNFNDLDLLNFYINNYCPYDENVLNSLNKLHSGLYYNFNDIKLQIILRLYLTSLYGQNGKMINTKKHYDYKIGTTLDHYFKNFDIKNYNSFELILIKNANIVCDKCSKPISLDILNSVFYHNDESGDLCHSCYEQKKMNDKEKIKYYKRIILLQGKRARFKLELEKTKLFLDTYKIKKLKRSKYYTLLENINKSLLSNTKNTICKICHELLITDIYVGSECGHCFHKRCIELSNPHQCQLCRIHTPFIKLYL